MAGSGPGTAAAPGHDGNHAATAPRCRGGGGRPGSRGSCPGGGFLANSAERRNYLIYRLRQTRAELARAAVAEERLRIARDLHDLLGHSLSLIALKAELAGRLVGPDPARAAQEIADLETVARRSLTEVRQAVTSYRQPGLTSELAAGRRMLAAAGVDCRVEAPSAYSFPAPVDTLLAWTVREGTTNIVRHSGARQACIRVGASGSLVWAELTDDGAGAGPAPAGPAPAGSGLAGLAERAARLGGSLQTGARDGGGFRLRVSVPLAAGQQPGETGQQQGETGQQQGEPGGQPGELAPSAAERPS